MIVLLSSSELMSDVRLLTRCMLSSVGLRSARLFRPRHNTEACVALPKKSALLKEKVTKE